MKKPLARSQKLKRWATTSLIVLLTIPALQVAGLWFVNPPTTGPMMLRWCAGRFDSQPYVASQYRWVELNAVSRDFSTAVWQWEDHRFFEHWGFDWSEIQKARLEARVTGKPARGASTITQQCARSLFLRQGRSWLRKGMEAYYTLWMELLLSKRRIFELYVNVIEYGSGIYGIEAAAQHYYSVSAQALTLEQAAMLVTILPQPRVLDPKQPTEKMLQRQVLILERIANARFQIIN